MTTAILKSRRATNSPNVPVNRGLDSAILASAYIQTALSVVPESITMGEPPDIAALLDRKGSTVVSESTASERPHLVLDAIEVGDDVYPAAQHEAPGKTWLFGTLPVLTEAFTIVIIGKANDSNTSTNERICGNRTAAGQETYVGFNTSAGVQFRHGNGTINAARPAGQWMIIFAASDGNGAIKLKVNDGAVVTGASNESTSSGGFVIGAGNASLLEYFTGMFKRFDFHDADLFTADGGAAIIDDYLKLVRNYGINA